MSKINETRPKQKLKGSKSTRGGTPAPPTQNRNTKPSSSLAITSSAPGIIERSISNECIRNSNSRFTHHSNNGRTKKTGNKQNKRININNGDKSSTRVTKS